MFSFLNYLRKDGSVSQIIKYGIVGVVSNLAGYSAYLIATYFGGEPKITMSVLYLIMALLSFLGNRKLTFAYTGGVLGSGVRFAISHILGYIINLIMLIVLVDLMNYPHQWVQASAIIIVAGFLFVMLKLFVFKK